MAYQAGGSLALVSNQQITGISSPSSSAPSASTEPPRVHRFPQRPATAEQVLKSFNTRAFRREQPDNRDTMLSVISRAIAACEPVPFVMYWGKGLRPMLAAPEYACLDYLATMLGRVEDCYQPGARMTLVFTDTHASLNGHSQESIETYFADFDAAARSRGFLVCRLSTLMDTVEIETVADISLERPSDEVLAGLSASAAKWFRGDGTAEEGALRYYRANMVERRVTETAFPHTIFVTFNGSSVRSLFPESMPIFYMFSIRPGVSDKPWFLPPDFAGRSSANNGNVEILKSA
jgi:L-tyrosine isonitrile synthase